MQRYFTEYIGSFEYYGLIALLCLLFLLILFSRRRILKALPLITGITLTFFAQLSLSNQKAIYGLILLALSIVPWFFISRDNRLRQSSSESQENIAKNHRLEVLIAIIILIAAFGVRVYRINSTLMGIHLDGVLNAYRAIEILQGKAPSVVYHDASSQREGLLHFFLFLGFKLLGVNVITIKLVALFWGMISLVLIYLLAHELLGRRCAIVSLFLLGFSYFHIRFSLENIRTYLVTPFVLLTIYCLLRAIRQKGFYWYIFAGIALGLGFYTYPTFRVMPIIVLWTWLVHLKFSFSNILRMIGGIILLGVITVSILIPAYSYDKQQHNFFSPSVIKPVIDLEKKENIEKIKNNLLLTLKSFNFESTRDPWFVVYFRNTFLPFMVAGFFLVGLILCFLQFFTKRSQILLSWLLISLIPLILYFPFPRRYTNIIPVALLIASFGMERVLFYAHQRLGFKPWMSILLLIPIFASHTHQELNEYYNGWLKHHGAYLEHYHEMWMQFEQYLDECDSFLLSNDTINKTRLNFYAYSHTKDKEYYKNLDVLSVLPIRGTGSKCAVVMIDNLDAYTVFINEVRQRYPNMQLTKNGTDAILFVPAQDLAALSGLKCIIRTEKPDYNEEFYHSDEHNYLTLPDISALSHINLVISWEGGLLVDEDGYYYFDLPQDESFDLQVTLDNQDLINLAASDGWLHYKYLLPGVHHLKISLRGNAARLPSRLGIIGWGQDPLNIAPIPAGNLINQIDWGILSAVPSRELPESSFTLNKIELDIGNLGPSYIAGVAECPGCGLTMIDTYNDRLLSFGSQGDLNAVYPLPPDPGFVSEFPVDICCGDFGEIYLIWRKELYRYHEKKLEKLTMPVERQVPFRVKQGLEGDLYVLTTSTNLYRLNGKLEILNYWGGYGFNEDRWLRPWELMIDPLGRVVVYDILKQYLHFYLPDGTLVERMNFPKPGPIYMDAAMDSNGYFIMFHEDKPLVIDNHGYALVPMLSHGLKVPQIIPSDIQFHQFCSAVDSGFILCTGLLAVHLKIIDQPINKLPDQK